MAINIRKFALEAHSLDELIALGTNALQAAHFPEAAVGTSTPCSRPVDAGHACWMCVPRDPGKHRVNADASVPTVGDEDRP
jgi:hypothetical protein